MDSMPKLLPDENLSHKDLITMLSHSGLQTSNMQLSSEYQGPASKVLSMNHGVNYYEKNSMVLQGEPFNKKNKSTKI